MSTGLENVAMFGCVINLFHKGKSPPSDFWSWHWNFPSSVTCHRTVVKSCSVGHWESQQSTSLVTTGFLSWTCPFWEVLAGKTIRDHRTQYSFHLTELPGCPRHMCSEEASTTTWLLDKRKVSFLDSFMLVFHSELCWGFAFLLRNWLGFFMQENTDEFCSFSQFSISTLFSFCILIWGKGNEWLYMASWKCLWLYLVLYPVHCLLWVFCVKVAVGRMILS